MLSKYNFINLVMLRHITTHSYEAYYLHRVLLTVMQLGFINISIIYNGYGFFFSLINKDYEEMCRYLQYENLVGKIQFMIN